MHEVLLTTLVDARPNSRHRHPNPTIIALVSGGFLRVILALRLPTFWLHPGQ